MMMAFAGDPALTDAQRIIGDGSVELYCLLAIGSRSRA